MSLKLSCVAAASFTILAGCATTSKEISAVYVSPLQYASYDCDQLGAEAGRIQGRASQIGGLIDQSAKNGNIATTAAVILFWPAAFFTGGGNKEQQAELSRLKGEQDAVQQAAIARRCPGLVGSSPAPAANVPTTQK